MSQELTEGLIDVGGGVWMDNDGNYFEVQAAGEEQENQWMWGDRGIQALGGSTPHDVTPFMEIMDEYLGGAPIQADSAIQAALQSLEGFMRTTHIGDPRSIERQAPVDPVTMFDPSLAGDPGSQFRIGELQDLVQSELIAGNLGDSPFFDTGGSRRLVTDENIDPVTGQPLGGGGLGKGGGTQAAAPANQFGLQANQWWEDPDTGERISPDAMFDPLMGLSPTDLLLAFEDVPVGGSLEKMVGPLAQWLGVSDEDFNDYLFLLDMQKYSAPAELVKANPEAILGQFMDTPGYLMAFGDEGRIGDPTASPTERFQESPGYQFQQEEGLRQVAMNQASRGLLDSGNMQREMQNYSQNLANQEYGSFMGRQMGLYGDWQNQLRGMASQGLSVSQGNQQMQAGGALGNIQNQLGENLGTMFGNQGTFGASGILNTGAAQASNVMQAANINAQIAAANAASGGGGGGFMGQLGGALGTAFGGPIGGALGSSLGGSF